MRYLLLFFLVFIVACSSDAQGDEVVDKDLCLNYECGVNERCVEDGDGIDTHGEVSNGIDTHGEVSVRCKCDDGYILNGGLCVLPEIDPCDGVECGVNEKCVAKEDTHGEVSVRCECNDGYILKNDECVLPEVETGSNSILIYGDTRDHEEEVFGVTIPIDSKHPEVVSAMMREIASNENDIKYIFNSGDLVYDGNDSDAWVDFFEEIDPFLNIDIAYYPVLGNHEHNSDNYFSNFNLTEEDRYYILDIYGVRFIALDSNTDLSVDSVQYNWLVDKLSNLPINIKFVAVLFHHPLFSSGHHGGDTELRAILHPLFIEKKVDLVFNGHDHSYERLEADGIKYIVTGGGGAVLDPTRLSFDDKDYSQVFESEYHYTLLTIDSEKIVIKAKDRENRVFDTITVNTQR